jgi:hypothetical protein
LGVKVRTGYPVIIVVVIVVAGMKEQATFTIENDEEK